MVQHAQIQLIDQAGVLQLRNKLRRRKEPFVRIDPPGQRFLVADPLVHSPHDRLIINLDPLFPDGFVNGLLDILSPPDGLRYFRAVVID